MNHSLYKKDLLVALLLLCISCVFFARLFYPEPSIFFTPEFGKSDITHLNLPFRKVMAESLSSGKIPLWENDIGSGYPIFAQGEMGTFYLPNLILFSSLPYWRAFNIGYIVTFFIASLGMYALARYGTFDRKISVFIAIIFSYSGYFIGHINHYNLIQAASLLPWLVLLLHLFIKKSGKYSILFILILSQQMFTGHMQTVFITLMALGFSVIFIKPMTAQSMFKRLGILACVVFIAIILSAIQLLPSQELHGLSVRAGFLSLSAASYFSYPYMQLLTFINPFILGKVSNGTYQYLTHANGTIFWETASYIGLISFLLVGFGLTRIKKVFHVQYLFFGIIIFLLLAFGKFSPIYFAYSIPPFNFFRVPARYILLVIFFMTLLSGYGLQALHTKVRSRLSIKPARLVIIAIIIITLFDIFYHWINYHPTVPIKVWQSKPELASEILKGSDNNTRIVNIESVKPWVSTFIENGWKNKEFYIASRNTLDANSNLFWDIPHFQSYVGLLWTRRFAEYEDMMFEDAITLFTDKEGNSSQPLLHLAGISHIMTSDIIVHPDYSLINEYSINDELNTRYRLYIVDRQLPRARMVYSYRTVNTLEEINNMFHSDDFDPSSEAILEGDVDILLDDGKDAKSEVIWIADKDGYVELKVMTNKKGLLILSDSYYKGWEATIDDLPVHIYPANLNQRAIVIEKGKHVVNFMYNPPAYNFGKKISIAGYVVIILLLVFQIFYSRRRASSATH